MNQKLYLILAFSMLGVISCKKKHNGGDIFTQTTYKTLGPYNSSGLPSYLAPKDSISSGLNSFMDSILQNGRNLTLAHPELFSNSAIADVAVKSTSDAYITFVHEDAGLENSIAFYTYPTGHSPQSVADIKEITFIFPSAGDKTPLQPGDRVKIGTFPAGTSIGFILMTGGWDNTNHKIDVNVTHYCTNDILNPEKDPSLRKHAVIINYAPDNKVLIGFEDTDRSLPACDNDFNDAIIYCDLS